MIYFTSDTHFGHENIIKMCNRPFSSVEEMDETLVDKWNAKVKGNDTVYVLGDMFFRCTYNPEDILRRLKGKKILLEGNHDGSWMGKVDLQKYFLQVDKLIEVSDGTRGMTLCHYPMLTWKHAKKNAMIHGHIHNDISADYWPLLLVRANALNAGVDINNFEPVSFDELWINNIMWKGDSVIVKSGDDNES